MSAAPTESRGPGGMSIGAVLRQLQPDFPDLTISKIRFLEAEGLITPERRASGYRHFTDADVARLRFILTAQRDRFWPLKVIRDALDRLDRGLDVLGLTAPTAADPVVPGEGASTGAAPGAAASAAAVTATSPVGAPASDAAEADPTSRISPAALRRRRSVRLTPAELRERTGLDPAAYGQLKAFGLLRTDAGGRHLADDLDVARAAVALAAHGLEARHLRLFRVAADREIGLTEQILEPLRRRQARGGGGADPAELEAELLSHSVALHLALVRAGLARGR